MSKSVRILSLLTCLLLMAGVASGCGSAAPGATASAQPTVAAATASPEPTAEPQGTPEATVAPLHKLSDTPVTFTIWKPGSPAIGKVVKSYDESAAFQEMAKISNITLKFDTPVFGQEVDKFNIMIASGEYPDLIEGIAAYYSGGGDKAISDGVILKLNDYIDKEAPDYTAARKANKTIEKETVTDSGNMYQFEEIVYGETVEPPAWGLAIRQDWLDDLGLKAPVTFTDLHDTLKAFKDQKGAAKPFSLDASGVPGFSSFTGGLGFYVALPGGICGTNEYFYQVDGKVKYGPSEPGYKDYLTMMAQWYSEGLVDPDFLSVKTFNDLITVMSSGKSGVAVLPKPMFAALKASSTDPKFRVVALANPVKNPGDTIHVVNANNWTFPGDGIAISTNCKDPDLATQYLNMWYTDAGTTLLNYGVEGLSYNLVDGKPQETELLMKNPDGLSLIDALTKYCVFQFAFRSDYSRQYVGISDDQMNAHKAWLSNADTAYNMPSTSLTGSEASEYAEVMNDINTYVQENTVKMIMGLTPLTEYDKMVQTISSMGIDKAIAAKQAALDRYNSR